MQEYISRTMTAAEGKEALDQRVKQILADKQILAAFLTTVTKEFRGVDKETAMKAIEGEPEVGTRRVEPGLSKIRGEATESAIEAEGRIFYDVRCHAVTQDEKRIKILINVEAQGDYYPGYPIPSRGVFYCARMLSEQMDTEFEADDYGDIKKVYSIWVCINSPRYAENSILEFSISPKVTHGSFPEEKARGYDLMSVIQICLGGEKDTNHSLCGMLYTLLKSKEPIQSRKRELEEKYNIRMTRALNTEVENMCNYSDVLEREARAKGRAEEREVGNKIIYSLVARGKLLPEDAAESLEITVDQLRANMINIGFEFPKD